MFDFPACVSDDYNRVVLDQLPDVPDSDYINASYVDVSIPAKRSNFFTFFFFGIFTEVPSLFALFFQKKKKYFRCLQFVCII